MRRVTYDGAGGNEVVSLVSSDDPRIGDEEVLVAARYAGVNPLDVLQRDGKYPVPHGASQHLPGVEVAGTVVAVGSKVGRWDLGDRVMGLVNEGGLADRVAAHQHHLLAVPDQVTDLVAAALPEAVLTAFDALVRGRTRMHDRVAIRGANGGVGIATYQLATVMGARPLGIARSAAMADALSAIGVEAVAQESAAEAFSAPDGCAVMIELVGGAFVAEDLELIAPRGRIVVVSVAAGDSAPISTQLLLGKRADVMGTVLRPRSTAEKAMLVEEVRRHVLPFVADARVAVPVEKVFAADDVAAAFDHLETPGKIGKVILDFGD